MKLSRLSLAVLGASVALVASACGGSQDVPSDAVAVVDGTSILRSELDEHLDQAKQSYEAQNQDFPKVGTPEYKNVEAQYVKFLVQRAEFEKEAEELGIEVTDKDVDKEIDEFVKSRFEGKRKEFEKALKQQGFSEEALRETLYASVLLAEAFDAVTKDVGVPPTEIAQYYQENQAATGRPSRASSGTSSSRRRTVTRSTSTRARRRPTAFTPSSRTAPTSPRSPRPNRPTPRPRSEAAGSRSRRGETVPEFDKMSFDLEQGTVSKPVKTTYGYHIIEAVSPIRKAKTTPLSKVRASIKATLLQEKRTAVMTQWIEDLESDYESKVTYASGYEPPELPEDTNTETEAETE